MSIYCSVYLIKCAPVCMSVPLSFWLTVWPSDCLNSVCPKVRLSYRLITRMSQFWLSDCLTVRLTVWLSDCQTVCLLLRRSISCQWQLVWSFKSFGSDWSAKPWLEPGYWKSRVGGLLYTTDAITECLIIKSTNNLSRKTYPVEVAVAVAQYSDSIYFLPTSVSSIP